MTTEPSADEPRTNNPVTIEDEHFAKTIVLCPSKDGLRRPGERTIEWYRRKGATIIRSDGISNITEHRNLIAGIALDLLQQNRDNPDAAPYWWVLWLDDDQFLPEDEARRLVHYALALTPEPDPADLSMIVLADGTQLAAVDAGDPLRFTPICSAAYPSRTNPETIAATLLEEFPLRYVRSFENAQKRVPCFPALTGLGTALQSAPAFWEMVASSPASASLTDPKGRRPLVFQSAGTQNQGSEFATFFSEDFWYCRLAWRRKLGAYVVPARSGHLVTQLAMLPPSVFDQLHDEATQKAKDQPPPPAAEPEKPPTA